MPKYRWILEFDAEDDKEADSQVGEATEAFHSIHSDELIQLAEGEE